MPWLVDYDDGDGDDEEGEEQEEGRGFHRHYLPFSNLFLPVSFSETIPSASNPKSRSHCSLLIFSKISRSQLVDKFY